MEEFGNVGGYTTNTQTLKQPLYTQIVYTMACFRKNFSDHSHSQQHGVNLTNNAKDLYDVNYKILKKETEDKNEKKSMFMNYKKQYHQTVHYSKSNLQIQCDTVKIAKTFF